MAIVLVSNVLSTNGADTTTSGAINTTNATLLVVAVSSYKASTDPTVSDSKSNTWIKLTSRVNTTNSRICLYYVVNPIVGTGHTFTATSTGSYPALMASSFSGVATTSPFVVENGFGATGLVSTIQPGSVTPSQNGSLIISAIGDDTAVTLSVGSSLSITNQTPWVSAINMGGGLAYYVQPAISAINPIWASSGTSNMAATIAVFKPSGSVITKTQSSIAKISINKTKTQSSTSRIYQILGTDYYNPNFSVSTILTKSQTSISKISNSLTKTQTSVGRVSNYRTKIQNSISKISTILIKTQLSTARIVQNNTITKTQTTIAKISTNITKIQTATANIIGTNSKINIGDVFKEVSGFQINIGDTWKTVSKIQINIGDVWKDIF